MWNMLVFSTSFIKKLSLWIILTSYVVHRMLNLPLRTRHRLYEHKHDVTKLGTYWSDPSICFNLFLLKFKIFQMHIPSTIQVLQSWNILVLSTSSNLSLWVILTSYVHRMLNLPLWMRHRLYKHKHDVTKSSTFWSDPSICFALSLLKFEIFQMHIPSTIQVLQI